MSVRCIIITKSSTYVARKAIYQCYVTSFFYYSCLYFFLDLSDSLVIDKLVRMRPSTELEISYFNNNKFYPACPSMTAPLGTQRDTTASSREDDSEYTQVGMWTFRFDYKPLSN